MLIKLTMDFGVGGKQPCWIESKSISAVESASPPWQSCVETHGGCEHFVIETPEVIVGMMLGRPNGTEESRIAIADEIVRRVDTVTLLRPSEVSEIRRRALAGEFDDIFAEEVKKMNRCKICGTDLSKDLFAYVAGKPTCAICTTKYIGGNFSPENIGLARLKLALKAGEYLKPETAA